MGFLKGKTAIITGGGRSVLKDGSCGSIGYGIATAYAKEGANLVITGRNKKCIEDHFDKSVELEMELEKNDKIQLLELVQDISDMVDIHYIRQKEPKGLGHAIHCAKTFVGDEPFAVLLGDDVVDSNTPCLKQLIDCYNEYNTTILGVQTVPEESVSKYGIVNGIHIEDKVYKVKDLVEKPSIEEAPSNTAILGRYIVTPKIFDILDNTKPGKGNEIQLTDAIAALQQTEIVEAYRMKGQTFDCGSKLGYLKAVLHYGIEHPKLGAEFKGLIKELAL